MVGEGREVRRGSHRFLKTKDCQAKRIHLQRLPVGDGLKRRFCLFPGAPCLASLQGQGELKARDHVIANEGSGTLPQILRKLEGKVELRAQIVLGKIAFQA